MSTGIIRSVTFSDPDSNKWKCRGGGGSCALAIPFRHPLFLLLSHDQLQFCSFLKPSLLLHCLITYKAHRCWQHCCVSKQIFFWWEVCHLGEPMNSGHFSVWVVIMVWGQWQRRGESTNVSEGEWRQVRTRMALCLAQNCFSAEKIGNDWPLSLELSSASPTEVNSVR